jgi:hypothetical protein
MWPVKVAVMVKALQPAQYLLRAAFDKQRDLP